MIHDVKDFSFFSQNARKYNLAHILDSVFDDLICKLVLHRYQHHIIWGRSLRFFTQIVVNFLFLLLLRSQTCICWQNVAAAVIVIWTLAAFSQSRALYVLTKSRWAIYSSKWTLVGSV